MKISECYLPEGSYTAQFCVQHALLSREGLRQAAAQGTILESVCIRCTPSHDLIFQLGEVQGIMPRACCALGIREGTTREISILTRVGKPTCFVITELDEQSDPPTAWLSRTIPQCAAQKHLVHTLTPGDVLSARVTHLESFGAFVDIGCGVVSLLGIETLSVSRIAHPQDRLCPGQFVLAAVRAIDPESGRITLTHRELLGTWEQNASAFCPGETVRGLVRSIEPYGAFIELTPNLSGLAEPHSSLAVGQEVSVYIKSIVPERMKIKLSLIDFCQTTPPPSPPRYYFSAGDHIDYWQYSPSCCLSKKIETDFRIPPHPIR